MNLHRVNNFTQPFADYLNTVRAACIFFYPIFEVHFFLFKELFKENSDLMYGYYSRAFHNQEHVSMARVW